MRLTVVALAALAAADLVACGAVLAVVWVAHQRQRRAAREAGELIPSAATGQFVFLAALGLLGIVGLYATVALLLEG